MKNYFGLRVFTLCLLVFIYFFVVILFDDVVSLWIAIGWVISMFAYMWMFDEVEK